MINMRRDSSAVSLLRLSCLCEEATVSTSRMVVFGLLSALPRALWVAEVAATAECLREAQRSEPSGLLRWDHVRDRRRCSDRAVVIEKRARSWSDASMHRMRILRTLARSRVPNLVATVEAIRTKRTTLNRAEVCSETPSVPIEDGVMNPKIRTVLPRSARERRGRPDRFSIASESTCSQWSNDLLYFPVRSGVRARDAPEVRVPVPKRTQSVRPTQLHRQSLNVERLVRSGACEIRMRLIIERTSILRKALAYLAQAELHEAADRRSCRCSSTTHRGSVHLEPEHDLRSAAAIRPPSRSCTYCAQVRDRSEFGNFPTLRSVRACHCGESCSIARGFHVELL